MKKVIAKLLIMLMITLTYGPYFNATSAIYASEDTETVLDRPTKLADVLGVCHMSAYYNFTDEDILNEGANQILDMGGRVIKVWFHPGVIGDRGCYAFNSNWPDLKNTSLVELAQIEYFKELFEKPFTTYIMNTYENPLVNWKNGLSEDEEKFIKKEFYDLAKYLLTTYKNTRKTFVISNWEGDGALNVKDIPEEKRATAYQGMADWLNARQEAITQAREEVGMNGVKVVGAAEFNYIPSQKEKDERKFEEMFGENITFGVDTVVPLTKMDLYSFSTWGTNTPGTEETLIEKLDYYASKAPDSELY